MRHIPGTDHYGASLDVVLMMIERLINLQWRRRHDIDAFLSVGLPDHRAGDLLALIDRAIEQNIHKLTAEQAVQLSEYRHSLGAELDELKHCGLPDTLVHGDFHPGNWRGEGNNLTILDWGDCVVGNPMLDLPAVLRSVSADDHKVVTQHWVATWQKYLPAANVEKAATLVAPLGPLRLAGIYQHFLDNIEQSEHVYHAADPLDMLTKTIRLLAAR